MAKPPTSVRSIRLADTMWAALQARADSVGVSLNRYVAGQLEATMRKDLLLAVRSIVEAAPTWPSGALIEPHHTEDPAPKLTLGSSVTYGPRRAKPGELSKPGKGAKR